LAERKHQKGTGVDKHKGTDFYHRKVKEIIKADQLKEEGREVQ